MTSKAKIYLIAILLGALIITGWAKAHRGGEEFRRFLKYYYLNPEPEKAPEMLEKFFESEFFTDEQICDAHCQDITAYCFARIGQLEPKLIENYKSLFENGTHKQRLFLLKILQLCGDQNVRTFFTSKLAARRFINERRQIKQVLEKAIPIEVNPLAEPVTEAGDLDFLWAEFTITGNKAAIIKIIESLDQDSSLTESLLLAGAAKWSLSSNCKEHEKVFEICKEELLKASGAIKEVLEEIVTEFEMSGAGHGSTKLNKERLEARVKELLKEDNVSLRGDVDELFSLADIYASEGNDEKAIALYQKALAVNSWRLEYQLKLAQLFKKHDEKEQSIDKAKVVYQHAEDESLIQDAENLLKELEIKPPTEKTGEQQIADNVEIVIVPIGEVNKRFLNEVKEELQKRVKIKYSISETKLDPGKVDRSYADKYLARVIDHIKSKFPQKNIQQLLAELTLKEVDLESYEGRVKFIEGFLAKVGSSQGEIEKFHNNLKKRENSGQYNASRLLSELEKQFKIPKEESNVKGYLGITEKDIFAKDFNFLYGWAQPGYGVVSYHRFKASFNNELPNRLRLRNRSVKQGMSSSFFILGVPRCTTPTCVRAYPHDLEEHDQKGLGICSWCRERLNSIIDRNK